MILSFRGWIRSGDYDPTNEEIQAFEHRLVASLSDVQTLLAANLSSDLLAILSRYTRKYRGIQKLGVKQLAVELRLDAPEGWATSISKTHGGGEAFLHALYDLKTDTLIRLQANSKR